MKLPLCRKEVLLNCMWCLEEQRMTNESIIESLLFAAGDEGLSAEQLADVLDVDVQTVQHVIERMAEALLHDDMRGVTITTYGEEYRLMTKKENAPFIQALAEKPSP